LRENVKIPYLPPSTKNYTLVLDLDETLAHLVDNDEEDGSYCYFRPGVNFFLKTLSKYYEIVVFTAAMPDVSQF
jgi:CTD small phosphatase-like protein 2